MSFHNYGDFFPGTGASDDVGYGQGQNYSVNVPLREGMDDESYALVYEPVMAKARLAAPHHTCSHIFGRFKRAAIACAARREAATAQRVFEHATWLAATTRGGADGLATLAESADAALRR